MMFDEDVYVKNGRPFICVKVLGSTSGWDEARIAQFSREVTGGDLKSPRQLIEYAAVVRAYIQWVREQK